MRDISTADLRTMYRNSLVLWKGTPVSVMDVREDYIFTVYDLKTQSTKRLKWIPENFTAPTVRIGYVNLGTNCVYCHRVPSRRYKIGLSSDNVKIIHTEHPLSEAENDVAAYILHRMRSPQLYKALVGEYPSLEEAYSSALECEGTVAFDKQFAVKYDGGVFFKGKHVGTYQSGVIEFMSGKEHLKRALI